MVVVDHFRRHRLQIRLFLATESVSLIDAEYSTDLWTDTSHVRFALLQPLSQIHSFGVYTDVDLGANDLECSGARSSHRLIILHIVVCTACNH